MGLESALWEATRPAFRVRYIHDPTSPPRVPLYASYGVATGPTARAKLARIVRKAPEVVVKVTGRQRGGGHVKAHIDYIGRKGDVEIETRDGETLTAKEDIAERAAEWSDTLNWRSRPTVSVSLIFSMPEGTDPEKVLGAVRALAHAELSDNHDYVLALHTDTPRAHVHLTVQAEGLDRTRFNPRPVQLNRFRERFWPEQRIHPDRVRNIPFGVDQRRRERGDNQGRGRCRQSSACRAQTCVERSAGGLLAAFVQRCFGRLHCSFSRHRVGRRSRRRGAGQGFNLADQRARA